MGNYEVHRTHLFDKKLEDFNEAFKERIDEFETQLSINPYVGKPLGCRWFREKKADNHRMYYLIYEDLKAVYIITLSSKKDQQKIINTIKHFINEYRKEIEELIT